MEEVRYMISEASKRINVEAHVLRYWEDELELEIERNELGHRYYKEADIELLKMVKKLKAQGFQLKAVKMLLPNLGNLDSLDSQTMIRLKDELNGKVTEMWYEENLQETVQEDNHEREINNQTENLKEDVQENTQENIQNSVQETNEGTSLVAKEDKSELTETSNDKMGQFKAIMNQIILSALKENNTTLSEEIGSNVTNGVIKEMSYLMRLQEEKEEERYKKFDSTLRDYQKSRMMAAAAFEGKGRKKSKFLKKNKLYI
jgi:MerR family transcriptional regulator, light-induced transcriptional regulator